MSTYQPDPAGPFVEVPTQLAHAWTAGGYMWADLEATGGIPGVVLARLTSRNAVWARSVVKVYTGLEQYEVVNRRRSCQDGRAWLAPRPDGSVRLVTSRLTSTPGVQRRRFRRTFF